MNDIRETYVITSAVYGAGINNKFYHSLKNYCEYNNAELIILPLKVHNNDEEKLSKKLNHENILTGDYKLNNKIGIKDFGVKPQQIRPLTGLDRFIKRDGSAIIASTKQHLRFCASSNEKMPKILMTTGTITKPNYNLNNRIGRIALHDHEYGAVVVEVINDKMYHTRLLTANTNGKFYDFDTLYKPKGITTDLRPLLFAPGDWHTGETDEKVKLETLVMAQEYKPEILLLNDFMSSRSMNHHDLDNIISQYNNFQKNNLSLENELQQCVDDLLLFRKANPDMKIVIVKSNHDEALYRYLNEGRFINEPQNVLIGSKLLYETLQGSDPLQKGLEYIANKYKKDFGDILFLQRDDDYRVKGIYCSNHGDKGKNGSKLSILSSRRDYEKSLTGHSHSGFKEGQAFGLGTSTPLVLDYSKGGTSNWSNTHGFIYSNGKVQLVNVINGYHRGFK